MCDTLIALPKATADGSVLFAKNSDREPNEAHIVLTLPAQDYSPGSRLKCTYIEIPQVNHTNAVLLAKPAWMWGAEMGANECGVVIGNEAVFTRIPYEKGPALTGMDLLRLALERASTAREALGVITSLLETYGQGGNCGYSHPFYYHNSYLIGDPADAWVLETAGKQWAALQVRDVYAISNRLTIGSEWDLASDGLVDLAIARGWCRIRQDFHFARCYSDFLYTRAGGAAHRRVCSLGVLNGQKNRLTPEALMAGLRLHGSDGDAGWRPDGDLLTTQVCMHAGPGPVRINQTTGSMVSHLAAGSQTHWLTGTAAPCTSVFKPVWIDGGTPGWGPVPGKTDDGESLWWRHEHLHRAILDDYQSRSALIQEERAALEVKFRQAAQACREAGPADRARVTERCAQEAQDMEAKWLERVLAQPVKRPASLFYRMSWKQYNRQANLKI